MSSSLLVPCLPAARPAAPAFAARSRAAARRPAAAGRLQVLAKTSLQFIQGINEPTIPDVKLTRSRDGSSGVATFTFQNPSVFEASSTVGGAAAKQTKAMKWGVWLPQRQQCCRCSRGAVAAVAGLLLAGHGGLLPGAARQKDRRH